jgi:DNA-binding MarR family transcriptional regulator
VLGVTADDPTTDRDQVGRIADEIGHLFAQTRSMSVRAANVIDPSLQVAGLWVIRWLGRYGPATAGAVATGTSMDKSAVSRQVRALRDLGLIESEPDPEDGRSARLRVSDHGRASLEAVGTITRAEFRSRFADWSDDDLSTFEHLLARLNEH